MRRILPFVLAVLACGATVLRADESLAPAVLKDLKKATAFIKVDAGALKISGSGFLIKLSGGAGYIVTNNHVIDTSGPHQVGTDPRHHRVITSSKPPEISAVFFSGTPDELSLRAEVVVGDKDRDLAILLVKGLDRPIKPIDLNAPADLVETTPVFVFGFPFGQTLSIDGHNPGITVGRGTISSIRLNHKGDIATVQIDGALNPGNSGGPVVDAKGRLAGVAVATIVGSGIGLAIPPSELKQELTGRLGIAHIVAERAANKKDVLIARVTVAVIDPMSQIRSVAFYWVPTAAAERLKPASHLSELAAARKLSLKMEGAEASGSFDVPAPASGSTAIVYEASYVIGGSVSFSTRSDPLTLGEDTVAAVPPTPDVPAPANPPAAAGPAIPAPGGSEYIDAALTALASENDHTQISGADQLRIAPLDASHRAAVLAALAPHLASDDLGLRLACVKAYAHWATAREVQTLIKIAEATQEHAEQGSAPYAWAAAMVGLARLDPAAAQRAWAVRKSDFFFSSATSAALLKLAEQEPQHAGTALRLLREFDGFHPIIKFSLSEAIQFLKSDAASVRLQGCDALAIAPIEPAQRKPVLALLAGHLDGTDEGARVRYVRACAHWSDAGSLKDLQAIANLPKPKSRIDQDQSSAIAINAMVRLRAVQAVIDSYNAHGDNFRFRSNFTSALRDLAEGTGPEQALAWNLLQQQSRDVGNAKLHSLDAPGDPPAPPAPSPGAPIEKKADDAEAPALGIPAGALHGQILGKAFVPDRVEIQGGVLVIRSGKAFFPEMAIRISLNIRPGEPISGRKYHVATADPKSLTIFISRMIPGDKLPKTFAAERYQMDLEFGTLADDKVPGKIRFIVDGEQRVDLSGNFVADLK